MAATDAAGSTITLTPMDYWVVIPGDGSRVRSAPNTKATIITTLAANLQKKYHVTGEAHGEAIPTTKQASGSDDVWCFLADLKGYISRTLVQVVPADPKIATATAQVTTGVPVQVSGTVQGRKDIYESYTAPSHTLPRNFMAKYPTKTSQPGPEPRIFNIKGECAWYAAVVCYYDLDNYAPIRWGGEVGSRQYNGDTVTIYKGDGGNWPNLVQATAGSGTVTDVPEVGSLITFDRSDVNPWGHIGVVEDVRAGKDGAGNELLVVSISEYNRHQDQRGSYRDIAFPAKNGVLVNPGGIHFIKMAKGFRYS